MLREPHRGPKRRRRDLGRRIAAALSRLWLASALVRAALAPAGGAAAAEATPVVPAEHDFAAELPRLRPLEPDQALESFQLQPGFAIDRVAAEPLIASPVAVAWDENSRLYVCEMRGYSENRDDALSRIRILDDLDGDGRYDRSEVFADGLLWPTAVACWQGGVFVGDAPHIYYLKDADGDGRADQREIVYTGFGVSNVQGLLNSFTWTLDNRFQGATSSAGGLITRPDQPSAEPIPLRGRDFDFDPRTRRLDAASGGAQHGLSFDDWGRKYVSSNSDHLQQVMFEDRYAARNPYLAAPTARASIAADGPQAEVYRSSPVEAWRTLRTRLRMSGAAPGIVEGGGRAAGYFTGATGVTICRGDLLPDLRGLAIVGDVGSNLVHRKRIVEDGIQFSAVRIDQRSELLTSTDNWFRPVQFANGPDGALYIIDMYREVIEHPASLPPPIKRHLDLASGRDRGRLYRLTPAGYRARPLPKLGGKATAELVALLDHPNAWHRDTASRLLYERQDASAATALATLARHGGHALGRLHAMVALAGLDRLEPALLTAMLQDPDPRLREHALRLAERQIESLPQEPGWWTRLAADPDVRFRYQLAFTLGAAPAEVRRPALLALAKRDSASRWMRVAIQSSLADDAGRFLEQLAADRGDRGEPGIRQLLAAMATQISRRDDRDEVDSAIGALERLADDDGALALSLARALVEGRGDYARRRLSDASGIGVRLIGPLVKRAAATATDEHQSPARRVEAIESLALGKPRESLGTLTALLDVRQPEVVQLAAIQTLNQFHDPAVAAPLIAAWPSFSPRLRSAAAEAIFARPERLTSLLDAIEAGKFPASEIDPPRMPTLLKHPDPGLQARAAKLLGNVKLSRRQEIVDAYRSALQMSGDAARGKTVFGKVCAACHRVESSGHEIGPNLGAIGRRGAEAVLLNVLDPNREVNPQYVNYLCVTDDGRTLNGLLAAETATSITLRRAESQQDTVLRINIEDLRSTGLSIMPEGLEKLVDQQAMADLIAYLMQLP